VRLIGLAGPKRAGKDTVATMIQDVWSDWQRVAFAQPIKDMLRVGLDLTDRQLEGDLKEVMDFRYGKSPREMMETLGTEWGRDCVTRDLWFRIARNKTAQYEGPTIITDVRFGNEAEWVRSEGVLIHLLGRGEADQSHESRLGVEIMQGDLLLHNYGTVEELRVKLHKLLHNYSFGTSGGQTSFI